jgi:hypothetical protein
LRNSTAAPPTPGLGLPRRRTATAEAAPGNSQAIMGARELARYSASRCRA